MKARKPKEKAPSVVERRAKRAGKPCRTLVVIEDDERAAAIEGWLKDIEGRQFHLQRARCGAGSLEAKGARRADVVLLDVASAGPRGRKRSSLMRALAEEFPVVALVDPGDEASAMDALRLDVGDYLVHGKITPDLLDRSIRYARERHRLVRAHQRAEARLRKLVADDPDPALVTDMQGRLLFANPTGWALLPGLELGQPVATGGIQVPLEAEDTIDLEDGPTMHVRSLRIEWENRPAWLLQLRDATMPAQIQDLTAQLAQAEKLAVIGQLAAGVAHEINNPLAFILTNLSATLGHIQHVEEVVTGLEESASTDEERAAAQEVIERLGPELFIELRDMLEDNLDGVERIRTIVHELKSFSRRAPEERELVRVHDLVKSACRMVAAQIRHRATLVRHLGEVGPVMGNRVKLVQILTNLLINAAQSLPDHRGRQERIEVRTAQRDRWVVVSVSDTGTGVPEELRHRIFEPFFTTKSGDTGTGIGLSLSAELARQHEGELVLAETSPEGSTFELLLPVAKSVRLVRPERRPSTRNRRAPVGPGGRILLVDDEPNVRKSMMRILRSYNVVGASNGREALEALESQAFDAVICDLVMPDLDGVDVHEALSTRRPELLDRVIFTSGGAYTARTAAFVAKNDITFVEKPVAPQRLLEILERVLRPPEALPCT